MKPKTKSGAIYAAIGVLLLAVLAVAILKSSVYNPHITKPVTVAALQARLAAEAASKQAVIKTAAAAAATAQH